MYKAFCIEKLVVNEVGRPHWFGDRIFARGWEEAEALCDLMGWTLSGEFVEEIPAGPGASAFANEVVKQRDRDWLEGRWR